jgi:hypothetical protein
MLVRSYVFSKDNITTERDPLHIGVSYLERRSHYRRYTGITCIALGHQELRSRHNVTITPEPLYFKALHNIVRDQIICYRALGAHLIQMCNCVYIQRHIDSHVQRIPLQHEGCVLKKTGDLVIDTHVHIRHSTDDSGNQVLSIVTPSGNSSLVIVVGDGTTSTIAEGLSAVKLGSSTLEIGSDKKGYTYTRGPYKKKDRSKSALCYRCSVAYDLIPDNVVQCFKVPYDYERMVNGARPIDAIS